MSDVIRTETNSIGDIYTYVHADGIHSLHVYDAVKHKVMVTLMRYFPKVDKWTSIHHYDGDTEIVEIAGKLGKEIVDEWADTKVYADEIVGM